jgi:hypothetical protein
VTGLAGMPDIVHWVLCDVVVLDHAVRDSTVLRTYHGMRCVPRGFIHPQGRAHGMKMCSMHLMLLLPMDCNLLDTDSTNAVPSLGNESGLLPHWHIT